MISTKILLQRFRNMDRRKSVTYIILASIIVLLFGVIGFSMLLKGDSASSPLVSTKLRAALLTYKRTVVIKGATPTPVGSGGLPQQVTTVTPTAQVTKQAGITVSPAGRNASPTASQQSGVPSPTDTVILDDQDPDNSVAEDPTETPDDLLADADTETPTEAADENTTATARPTMADTLPETGSVQYPIILFISATVFLFVSFLF